MKIRCPNCRAEINLPISQIPPGGIDPRCPHCMHRFHLAPEGIAPFAPPLENLSGDADLEFALPQEDLSASASAFSPPTEAASGYGGLDDLFAAAEQAGAAPATAEASYYLRRQSGKIFGPFSVSQLSQMLEQQEINSAEQLSPDSQIWRILTDWPEFSHLASPVTSSSPEAWNAESRSSMQRPPSASPTQAPTAGRPQTAQPASATPGKAPRQAVLQPGSLADFQNPTAPPSLGASIEVGSLSPSAPEKRPARVVSALKKEEPKPQKKQQSLVFAGVGGAIVLLTFLLLFLFWPSSKPATFSNVSLDFREDFSLDSYSRYVHRTFPQLAEQLRTTPDHPQVLLGMALASAFFLENYGPDLSIKNQQKQSLAKILPPGPGQPIPFERLWLQALQALEGNRSKEAIDLAIQMQKIRSDQDGSSYITAKAHFLQRKYSPSLQEIDALLKKNPQHARALFLQGRCFAAQKNWNKAFQSFYQATLVSEKVTHLSAYLELFAIEEYVPSEVSRYHALWQEAKRRISELNQKPMTARFYSLLAKSQSRKGLHEEALASIQEAAKAQSSPEILALLPKLHYETRNYERMMQALEPRIRQEKPLLEEAIYYLRAAHRAKKPQDGRSWSERWIKIFPKDLHIAFYKARFEESLRFEDTAFLSYQQLLLLQPGFAAALAGQARIAFLKRQEKLLEELEAKLKSAPLRDPLSREEFARWMILKKSHADAFPVLEIALKEDPRDETLHILMGSVLLALKKGAEAQDHFERSLSIRSKEKNLEALSGLAEAFEVQNQTQKARALYTEYLQRQPQDSSALSRFGRLLYRAKEYAEAEKQLEKSIAIEEKDAEPHYYLARTIEEVRKGANTRSQSHLEIAVRLEPTNRTYLFRLARAYYLLGKSGDALKIYTDLLATPNQQPQQQAGVYFARSKLYLELKQYKDALGDLERVKKIQADFPGIFEQIGDTHTEAKRYPLAIKAYQDALKQEKISEHQRGDIYGKLGAIFRETSSYAKAIQAYRQASKFQPQNPAFLRALGYLHKDRKSWGSCIHALKGFLKYAPADDPDRREAEQDLRSCQQEAKE